MQIANIEWQKILKKRIIFGHQSVGYNIITGIKALADRDRVTLQISEDMKVGGPGIIHFKIGRNKDPISKINEFMHAINNGGGNGADVAMMKLCYVDFQPNCDAKSLADSYCAALNDLARIYPRTSFIAITSPLTTVEVGPKAWIKRILGRTPRGYQENARRAEFNGSLRQRCDKKGQLFDLARVESRAMGTYPTVSMGGQMVEILDPDLTSDGGHLNEAGRQLVAMALLRFLADLPEIGSNVTSSK